MRFRAAFTATGSALALACTLTPGARADTALPPAGSVVNVNEEATATIECNGHFHHLDLTGTGQILVGPTLATVDHHPVAVLTTTAETLTGSDAAFGSVTVTENAPASGELVEHSADAPFPATQALPMNLKIVTEKNPCGPLTRTTGSEGLVLYSGTPVTVSSTNVKAFPPVNQNYRLQEPVPLYSPGTTQPVGELPDFGVLVNQSG